MSAEAKRKGKGNKLTPKQERFAQAYVITGNASEAIRRAGYRAKPDTVRVMGAENLAKPIVKARIEQLEKKLNEDPRYSAEALAAWLLRLGEQAEERGELATAGVQAMNIAKLAGHLVDQTKVLKDAETESLMARLQELAPDLLNGA